MVGMKDAFKAAKLKGTVEVAQGTLTLLYRGTISRMFGRQAPITKKPHFLMGIATCIHSETSYNDAGEEIQSRCKWRAEVGFLCRKHDSQLLKQKSAPLPQPAFINPNTIQIDGRLIVEMEQATLAGQPREVIGLKHVVQFLDGVRMTSDPDKIKVPDAPRGLNDETHTPKEK